MINKKMKCGLGIICMIASAASYVQSDMPNQSWISCWGSIGFSGNTMRATTSDNGGITKFHTDLTGTLTKNGASLGIRTDSGNRDWAQISHPGANGYRNGSAVHYVYGTGATWEGRTSI